MKSHHIPCVDTKLRKRTAVVQWWMKSGQAVQCVFLVRPCCHCVNPEDRTRLSS